VLIDPTTGGLTPLFAKPLVGSYSYALRLSPGGDQLLVLGDNEIDPLVRPTAADATAGLELWRFDLTSHTLERLTANGFVQAPGVALAPDGRIAMAALLRVSNDACCSGADPEATNSDDGAEVFLVDPAAGGGFMLLQRVRVIAARGGQNDRFTMKGLLVRLGGPPLDPRTEDVTVTVLGVDGALFRATAPAGSTANRPAGLRRIRLTTSDGVYFRFTVSGQRAALVAASAPYLGLQIEVGSAVFGDAERLRAKRGRLSYP
jgi:hypothetical protein